MFATSTASADTAHYKNMLIGDRAATMGGSYVAVSDDSTGCYYNPAGIAHAVVDSISGSGNAYHKMKTVYSRAIGNENYLRESEALLPNYFGVLKKYEPFTICFSYVVPDAFIEHLDLVFDNPLSTIKRYYQSLHSEDTVYLLGPSAAWRISDGFSLGFTMYYHYRKFLRQQHEYVEATSGGQEFIYESRKLREDGVVPKFGMQWSPLDPLTLGMTLEQTTLVQSTLQLDRTYKNTSTGDTYNRRTLSEDKRKFPLHLALGVALYPSPSQLYSLDLDYFQAADTSQADALNFSAGAELFIDPGNALRFGVFTNSTNKPKPTSSTTAPYEYLDLNGITLGYTSYARTSSLTLGAVYSAGSGKAWLYSGSTESRNLKRESLSLIFAASSSY